MVRGICFGPNRKGKMKTKDRIRGLPTIAKRQESLDRKGSGLETGRAFSREISADTRLTGNALNQQANVSLPATAGWRGAVRLELRALEEGRTMDGQARFGKRGEIVIGQGIKHKVLGWQWGRLHKAKSKKTTIKKQGEG